MLKIITLAAENLLLARLLRIATISYSNTFLQVIEISDSLPVIKFCVTDCYDFSVDRVDDEHRVRTAPPFLVNSLTMLTIKKYNRSWLLQCLKR